MIVTIFRSRLNPGVQDEYAPMAKQMSELARTVPGYVAHKGFVAEDGERVTIVEFETEQALDQWRRHPEHAKAKRRGIADFFSHYKFQICTGIQDRTWTARSKQVAVSGLSRRRPERQIDDALNRLRRQRRLARRPRLVAQEAVDTLLHEALLPAPDHRLGLAGAAHHLEGATAVRRRRWRLLI